MKNKITTHFYVKEARKDRKSKAPIYLRITVNGERAEISTDRKIEPDLWDKNSERVAGRLLAETGKQFTDWITNYDIKFNHKYDKQSMFREYEIYSERCPDVNRLNFVNDFRYLQKSTTLNARNLILVMKDTLNFLQNKSISPKRIRPISLKMIDWASWANKITIIN
jgi:hypothetical protein